MEKFSKVLTTILQHMEAISRVKQLAEQPAQRFYTYILKGRDNWHYCGITQDIYRRYTEHNSKKSISTVKHGPYVLVWLKEVDSRTKARFIEVMIKKRGVRRFLQREQFTVQMHLVKRDIELFYHSIRMRSAN